MLQIELVLRWLLFGLRFWWWRMFHPAVKRAFIMERQGVYYDLYFGVRTTSDVSGETYEYADTTCLVPPEHPYEAFEDERLLGVVDGELVATPFKGSGKLLDAAVISNICRGNVARQYAEAYSISSRGFGGWKWLALVAGIVFVGYMIYKYALHGQIGGIGGTPTPTPFPTPAPGETPIYNIGAVLTWAVMNL